MTSHPTQDDPGPRPWEAPDSLGWSISGRTARFIEGTAASSALIADRATGPYERQLKLLRSLSVASAGMFGDAAPQRMHAEVYVRRAARGRRRIGRAAGAKTDEHSDVGEGESLVSREFDPATPDRVAAEPTFTMQLLAEAAWPGAASRPALARKASSSAPEHNADGPSTVHDDVGAAPLDPVAVTSHPPTQPPEVAVKPPNAVPPAMAQRGPARGGALVGAAAGSAETPLTRNGPAAEEAAPTVSQGAGKVRQAGTRVVARRRSPGASDLPGTPSPPPGTALEPQANPPPSARVLERGVTVAPGRAAPVARTALITQRGPPVAGGGRQEQPMTLASPPAKRAAAARTRAASASSPVPEPTVDAPLVAAPSPVVGAGETEAAPASGPEGPGGPGARIALGAPSVVARSALDADDTYNATPDIADRPPFPADMPLVSAVATTRVRTTSPEERDNGDRDTVDPGRTPNARDVGTDSTSALSAEGLPTPFAGAPGTPPIIGDAATGSAAPSRAIDPPRTGLRMAARAVDATRPGQRDVLPARRPSPFPSTRTEWATSASPAQASQAAPSGTNLHLPAPAQAALVARRAAQRTDEAAASQLDDTTEATSEAPWEAGPQNTGPGTAMTVHDVAAPASEAATTSQSASTAAARAGLIAAHRQAAGGFASLQAAPAHANRRADLGFRARARQDMPTQRQDLVLLRTPAATPAFQQAASALAGGSGAAWIDALGAAPGLAAAAPGLAGMLPPASSEAPSPSAERSEIDVEDLVERAWRALMTKLTVEHERRGFARWA